MGQPGRQYSAGTDYRYGFNGKEKDKEMHSLTAYDYGFRIYNPAIGKFLSLDPLTKSYPWYTPYQFAGNNPIHNIDLDGLEDCGYGHKLENQWIPALMSGKMTEAQFERNKLAFSIGGTAGLATIATVYSGGKAAPFIAKIAASITLYHVVSAFPHNAASTPEGRAQQAQESKEHLTSAFLWWGGGVVSNKIIGAAVDIFRGPVKEVAKYLFRGTSKGFPGSSAVQKLGVTPTSSDPGVATIFSVNSKNYGEGVLQIALPENLQGITVTANVLATAEKEIALGITPVEFTKKASLTISSDQARGILKDMGINIPAKIANSEISSVIANTPKMTEKQIETFYKEAQKLEKK